MVRLPRTLCLIVRRGTEVPYTPCLLIRPVLRLRLHVTQSQPCFPAAPNAIAFPGGNPIFAATLTERITHYTLQAKSCAKGQAPLETPTNNKKAEYPALSLCRIFNLYLLSAAPFHGLPFVSLSIMFLDADQLRACILPRLCTRSHSSRKAFNCCC